VIAQIQSRQYDSKRKARRAGFKSLIETFGQDQKPGIAGRVAPSIRRCSLTDPPCPDSWQLYEPIDVPMLRPSGTGVSWRSRPQDDARQSPCIWYLHSWFECRDSPVMARQASVQEAVGTAGQSRVTAQLEELGWGVAPNPYHDLGTDLWLMARDDRRFDLGLLVGAQVKTSETRSESSKYFKEPKREADGKIVGWWYRESFREDHFDDWIKHSVPHILVLHDLESEKSYWVHVTKAAIVRTKSGTKILVPKSQRINTANVGKLLDVALSQRGPQGTWEGSDWHDITALGPEDRIRYALLTPRLIAKRRTPRAHDDENPCQAIAMLVESRFQELDGTRQLAEHLPGIEPPPFLSADQARDSTDWQWNLYGYLHRYVHDGDADILQSLVETAQVDSAQRAAAVVFRAMALIERGRVSDALALTAEELARATSLDPVNFAWIEVQYARCLLEMGKYKKARKVAIGVQRIQGAAATDPTAMAIASSAASILFRTSGWLPHRNGSCISSADTAAGWWRNQTIAYGLETFLTDRFALWAAESDEIPAHFTDTWRRLRTATLLSGFAGDHSAWRTEYSELAQYTLQAYPAGQLRTEVYEALLTDLRIAGDVDNVKRCATKLLMAGPEAAVQRACVPIKLLESTHTTARADLELVSAAAEVLEQEEADRHVRDAVEILKHQRRYAKRVRPTFLIHTYVLQTLQALVSDSKVSQAGRRVLINYFLSLPAIADQSLAHGLARVLKLMPETDWTPTDVTRIRRRTEDNWELKDALVGIAATGDRDAEEELLNALRQGQTRMLSNVRDASVIPHDVAEPLIAVLSESVRNEVKEARGGTFYRHDARSLAMLNVWHPDVADWTPIYELLNEPRVMPTSLISLAAFIRDANRNVQQEPRQQLHPRLAHVRDRTPIDFGEWVEAKEQLRTVVREALDALIPGSVSDQELWVLVGGDSEQRSAAARIIGRRRDYDRLDILACLSQDDASIVRAHAAQWIAKWLENTDVAAGCNALLEDLASAPGTLVAHAIASGLRSQASRAAAGDWMTSLPVAPLDESEDG
jgi:hypothetical protein